MYIAIDGGGTKTEYLLLNEQFEVVKRHLGGCVNHDFLQDGWQGTKQELGSGIHALIDGSQWQIEDIKDVTAGLSGIDTCSDEKRIDECMRELGLQKFAVCNDGFLSVMAECPEGWGIAYNCGTGVCCVAIDEKNNQVKTAGLDEWSGDAGGGNWIVLQVYRQVYRDLFYRRETTVFAEACKRKLGVNTEAEFVDSLSRVRQSSEYPELQKQMIRLFFELFQAGDAEALAIGQKMLRCAADNVEAVMEQLQFSNVPIPLILTGSILTKAANEAYLDRLKEELQNIAGGRLEIMMAQKASVWGAVQWLKSRKHL